MACEVTYRRWAQQTAKWRSAGQGVRAHDGLRIAALPQTLRKSQQAEERIKGHQRTQKSPPNFERPFVTGFYYATYWK